MSSITFRFDPFPKAASRSMMWRPSAPSASHLAARSSGLSFQLVFFDSLPCLRVTTEPPSRSIAAQSSILSHLLTSRRKFLSIRLPVLPDFSGWNWVP